MIKILIADDSKTETLLLKTLFESVPDFTVVGTAANGKEAVELNRSLNPNIITMDIHMPIMNGLEAIKAIMMDHPVPVVVISSKLESDLDATYNALDAGALSVLEKPINLNEDEFNKSKNKIISTIRNMAEIRVVKRRFFTHRPKISRRFSIENSNKRQYELIAIGSSTGGPEALKKILEKIPGDFSLPIVIVQHMTRGYINGYTKWLSQYVKLPAKCADNFEKLISGTIYFAPDKHHLVIKRLNNSLIAVLENGNSISGFKPSITALMESVANCCKQNAIGILLTGMGNDGAQGLLSLKMAKAHTLIQDKESSIVFGMSGVAVTLGAVDKILPLDDIADYVLSATKQSDKT